MKRERTQEELRRVELYAQQMKENGSIEYEPWRKPEAPKADTVPDNRFERYVARYPDSGVESLGVDWYRGLEREIEADAINGKYDNVDFQRALNNFERFQEMLLTE